MTAPDAAGRIVAPLGSQRLVPVELDVATRIAIVAAEYHTDIVQADCGVVLYMAQEGRGIGLLNKLRAYELQEQGRDTVEANLELGFMDDQREYGIGAQILADLGLSTIKILTNNPRKIIGLEGYGLTVTEQVPIEVEPGEYNADYLRTKREKMGHSLHHQHIKAATEMPTEPPRMIDPAAGETAGAQQ